jgi:hypothetical protein
MYFWVTTLAVLSTYIAFAQGFPARGSPAALEPEPNLEELGDYFEGDMILDARNGIIGDNYRWPNNVVVYAIDPLYNSTENAKLMAALNEIANQTCIKFRERTTETNYVFIVKREVGAGCSSQVGLRGGRQTINLEPSCINRHGTLMHEMLHTIGFYHEQSRPDRDDYVTIMYQNIIPGKEHNFNKYTFQQVTSFGVEYDYGSVMHYSALGFSNDGISPTIVPKDPDAVIGQRVKMSESDIEKVQRMYKCTNQTH